MIFFFFIQIKTVMQFSTFKTTFLSAGILLCAGFTACSNNSDTAATTDTTATRPATSIPMNDTATMPMVDHAMASLSGTKPDTTVSGMVDFKQDGSSVKMNLTISVPKLANKSVAVHLHEHGDCGNMGKGAMGHWNPTNEQHGKWGSGQYHSGDIGNVQLDAKGNGTMELTTDRWSLGGSAKTNILNRAVIVHSGVDDYTSQPSGNAGERIGCGVIEKGQM